MDITSAYQVSQTDLIWQGVWPASLKIEHHIFPRLTHHLSTTYDDLKSLVAGTPYWSLFKQMTGKSQRVPNAIAFVLLFGMGAFLLFVVGHDVHHWYTTGTIYYSSKHGHEHSSYVSYHEMPVRFLAACANSLLCVIAGVFFVVAAFMAPSRFRNKEATRLASPRKSLPHPWRAD